MLRSSYRGKPTAAHTPSHKFVRIEVSAELEESKNTARELIRAVLRATAGKSVQLAPRKIAGRLHAS
jgi:uncharacterized protein (DUF2267 family)